MFKRCPNCNSRSGWFEKTSLKEFFFGGWTCKNCGYQEDWLGREVKTSSKDSEASSTYSDSNPQSFKLELYQVKQPTVNLLTEIEKRPVKAEEVVVPSGVTIRVKRSRTIEHTLEIHWRIEAGGNMSVSFSQLVSASIRGEIERQHGRTYQQSETIEYEVELNGEKANRYKLTWSDIWRVGTIEIERNKKVCILPFQFKESAELEVIPI